ncbi:MAG TPA: hypothetical protein VF756_18580 [Thermoanaerobaculia bacterium]
MITIETVAEIAEDGTLTVRAPSSAPRGRRRVVIVIDNESGSELSASPKRKLPDLANFRAQLGGKPYPGNSVVDLREEERS